jgi:hypothetical protein
MPLNQQRWLILATSASRRPWYRSDRVGMRIESRLVRDYHIRPGSHGAAQYIEGCHHGRRNAFHRNISASSYDAVHGLIAPGNAHVGFDAVDYFAGGNRWYPGVQSLSIR